MKKTIRSGGFFAKAEGAPSWKDRLAKMTGRAKPRQATAKLEIDDAVSGEKLIFPEIGDVSEIAEGVAVTATDGPHVFTADTTTYTVEVLGGKVVSVVETPIEEEAAAEMSAETAEFVEAVAEAMEAAETFQVTATAKFTKLESDLATALETIKTLKATMSHAKPKEGEGDDGTPKPFKINGKSINLDKINLK